MAIDTLRRFFLPCFTPSTTATTTTKPYTTTTTTQTKKNRSSTSLNQATSPCSSTSSSATTTISTTAPRPSKQMVIGTIFGNRRGHVWFCIQTDRTHLKPILLLELPISTNSLVHEMRNGLVRIALESTTTTSSPNCPLRSIPLFTAFCNGRKAGFAARRRAGDCVRNILQTMQCVTVGAGVIPSGFGSDSEELMYMRANFEHVVGNADSESFHLINPDESTGQELSVFLLRSRLGNNR